MEQYENLSDLIHIWCVFHHFPLISWFASHQVTEVLEHLRWALKGRRIGTADGLLRAQDRLAAAGRRKMGGKCQWSPQSPKSWCTKKKKFFLTHWSFLFCLDFYLLKTSKQIMWRIFFWWILGGPHRWDLMRVATWSSLVQCACIKRHVHVRETYVASVSPWHQASIYHNLQYHIYCHLPYVHEIYYILRQWHLPHQTSSPNEPFLASIRCRSSTAYRAFCGLSGSSSARRFLGLCSFKALGSQCNCVHCVHCVTWSLMLGGVWRGRQAARSETHPNRSAPVS